MAVQAGRPYSRRLICAPTRHHHAPPFAPPRPQHSPHRRYDLWIWKFGIYFLRASEPTGGCLLPRLGRGERFLFRGIFIDLLYLFSCDQLAGAGCLFLVSATLRRIFYAARGWPQTVIRAFLWWERVQAGRGQGEKARKLAPDRTDEREASCARSHFKEPLRRAA